MNRADNKEVLQRLYCVGEDISGHGLHEVFRDLWAISFEPGPLPKVDTFIGHALGAKAVGADAGLDVGKPSAGRKVDE